MDSVPPGAPPDAPPNDIGSSSVVVGGDPSDAGGGVTASVSGEDVAREGGGVSKEVAHGRIPLN